MRGYVLRKRMFLLLSDSLEAAFFWNKSGRGKDERRENQHHCSGVQCGGILE